MDKQQIINEILYVGSINPSTRNQPIQPNTQNQSTPFKYSDLTPPNGINGVNIKYTASLDSWQQSALRNMTSNNDTYIVAPPSAGKTMPIIAYWADQILQVNPLLDSNISMHIFVTNIERFLNNIKNIPKIIFLCPVRALVDDIYNNFIGNFFELFGKISNYINENIIISTNNGDFQTVQILVNLYNLFWRTLNPDRNFLSLLSVKEQLLNRYIQTQNNNQDASIFVPELEKITVEINRQIPELLKHIITNVLLYKKTGADSSGNINTASIIVSIHQSASHILTDSILSNTKLIVIDESHLAQISKNENNINEVIDICTSLYNVFKKLKGSSRLVLMSGTINPNSAKNFCNYLNLCFDRHFKDLITTSSKNPSNITIIPNDSISYDSNLVKEIQNPSTRSTVIMLFSKNRIDAIVDKVLATSKSNMTLDQVNNGAFSRKTVGYNSSPSNESSVNFQRGLEITSKMINNSTNSINASDISDKRLKMAVSNGFGYLYRPNDAMDPKLAKDNTIVAKLFKDKKINVLLATNAIGIGVDLDVQRLLIPSCEKFNGSINEIIEPARLSQLLNRAGRRAFEFSEIHTPSQWIPTIINTLALDPTDFEMREVFGKFNKSWCYITNKILPTLYTKLSNNGVNQAHNHTNALGAP